MIRSRPVTLLASVLILATACTQEVVSPAAGDVGTVQCSNGSGDAGTLNTAISQSPDGSEIVISGTCSLTEPIKLLGGRTYRGSSRTKTVLRQADGANLPVLVASDSYLDDDAGTGQPLTIRDLGLDGNRAENSAATDGLVLRSWQSVAENLTVTDFAGSGIRVTNLSADRTPLETTQVNGLVKDNFITHSGRNGVLVEDTGNSVTDWQLTGNWIADSGLDGISAENAAGWIISHNHIYGVGNDGIWAQRMYGTTISDNYVEGFGEGDVGTWYGIGGLVQGGVASTIGLNRVFALEGERPTSTYRYIGIAGVNYGDGAVAVTGNAVRGTGPGQSTGLFYSKADGGSLAVTSAGNSVTQVGSTVVAEVGVTVTAGV